MHMQHWVAFISEETVTMDDTEQFALGWLYRSNIAEQRGNMLIVLEVPKNDLLFFSGNAADMVEPQLIDFELMKALAG